jgi:hypothetical protein
MPVGHSPTIANDVVYISVHDKTIHAVNINNGTKIWQTDKAGAGFDTSPLIANNRIYAGNRDGYFYAFNTSNGTLSWYYKTGGPISFSAAISADNDIIYFASNDGHAYGLNATSGTLVWKSQKLPGDGFYGFWPVINGAKVLYSGSNNFEKMEKIQHQEAFGSSPTDGELVGPVGADGYMDATRFTNYFKANPTKRTFFVLDRLNGAEDTNYAPILWQGNWSGNRQPPVVGPNSIVYLQTIFKYNINFLQGRVAGWQMGTSKLKAYPNTSDTDAQDENAAISIIGDVIYYNHKEDQYGKIMPLSGGSVGFWTLSTNLTNFPNYTSGWENRKYGNVSNNGFGTHGNVNPPVPLRDKVFFHISNSVVVFGQ